MALDLWCQVLHRGSLCVQRGHHPLPVCTPAVSGHQGPKVREGGGSEELRGESVRVWELRGWREGREVRMLLQVFTSATNS